MSALNKPFNIIQCCSADETINLQTLAKSEPEKREGENIPHKYGHMQFVLLVAFHKAPTKQHLGRPTTTTTARPSTTATWYLFTFYDAICIAFRLPHPIASHRIASRRVLIF